MDVIELNGNHNDALTGAYMDPAARNTDVLKPVAPQAVHRAATPHHQPAHRPQHARTLMRHAVKKPQATAAAFAPKRTAIGAQNAVLKPATPVRPLHLPKASALSPQPQRLQRAQSVARSQHVVRFSNGVAMPIATSAAPAAPSPTAVKPVMTAAAPKPDSARPRPALQSQQLDIMPHRPARAVGLQPAPAQPQPKLQGQTIQSAGINKQVYHQMHQRRAGHAAANLAATSKAQTLAPAKPFALAANRAQPARAIKRPEDHREQDIFEQALALATSHEQKGPKQSVLRAARRRKTLRRVFSIAASAAVFVSLAGFIAYQNKASIELQMASAKAGFPASAAGYKPSGFDMSRVSYDSGAVATWYKSPDKTFSVIQKKSNWDSQTLLENFVATTSPEYQGYSANGRTVYVYGKGRATWVNGGVWFQIHAGDALSNEQLVKVAANM
jgi:hypothetical protein